MRKLAALCGAVLLVLALAAPVLAVKPVYWYDEDFEDLYPAEGDCGDFVVDVREVGHHSELLYFTDKTYETIARTLYQARGTSTLINHDTGQEITGKFSVQCHVDVLNPDPELVYVRSCTGDFFNLSVPGKGLVAHDAGQFTEYVEGEPGASGDVLKEVGANWFDEDEVCAALR